MLKDQDVAIQAAFSLGQIGPAAREALPALHEAASHEPLRPWAEAAIEKIER
jgi:hypothetical protein